ncbi:MAG: hypothetical protein E6G85_11310 [Alphaproteobacteria bacterium]|nr:MAG: hypothetical protein E6G85_11310 [Alphaproteobacteria bacterium]
MAMLIQRPPGPVIDAAGKWRRPPARFAGRDFHLVAAFDFHRQIVFNGPHAKHDRIDASKPSQCSARYR